MSASRLLPFLSRAVIPFLIGQIAAATSAVAQTTDETLNGRDLFQSACAGCHGADGTGVSEVQLGFDTPVPDFTDCSFATREPDADWFAVAHDGGPVRAFDRMMPAFGDALSDEQITAILGYIRTLCGDGSWPPGELNLPRAMFTEKAYPEDEAVWTTGIAAEGAGSVENEFIYEKRFGARNQIEFVVPFGFRDREDGSWVGGVGDVAVGLKRAVFHRVATGSIFSVAGEVVLPTGNVDKALGSGALLVEPFVTFGQVLPGDGFFQIQTGAELPFNRNRVDPEIFWRGALGKTLTEGRFGRAWSPMVEVLGAREMVSGAETEWDIVPQFQVTLNTRQHVMANLAVRVPLSQSDVRDSQVLFYILLDWFDGALFDGW